MESGGKGSNSTVAVTTFLLFFLLFFVADESEFWT